MKELSLKEAREQDKLEEFARQQDHERRRPEVPNPEQRFNDLLKKMAKGK